MSASPCSGASGGDAAQPERIEQRSQVGGERRREGTAPVYRGQLDSRRVQGVAGVELARDVSVSAFPHEGVPKTGEVYAHLVGSPGLDPDLDQGRPWRGAAGVVVDHPVARERALASRVDPLPAPHLVVRDGRVDHALGLFEDPVRNGQVGLRSASEPLGPLVHERLAPHEQDDARGLAVELVNGPDHAAVALEELVLEAVRIVEISARGRQAGGLVDDYEPVRFVEHAHRAEYRAREWPRSTPRDMFPRMPMYDYHCESCGHAFEAIVSSWSDASVACPACKAEETKRAAVSRFAIGGGGTSVSAAPAPGACGTCGDPRGPGSCRMN